MQPMTNKAARQLSSTPLTHRASTLSAISAKVHDLTARIEHLGVEGKKMNDLIAQAPGDASSRLDWLHRQLTSI